MKSNELVTIILVSYFSKIQLKKILNKIPKRYSIIITENSLDINTKNEIEFNYKNVKVLIPNTNLGNGAGVNHALKNVKTKYALYLDLDIDLDQNTIKHLAEVAEKLQNWSIIAPNLINYSYKPYCFIKKNYQKNLSKMKFVEGCALFFNFKKLEQYGFYDERIFLYYEEDDLFFKYQKYNLDIILCENIFIKHIGNSSTNQKHKLEIEFNRNWHYMWSKFYYYKKNYSYFVGIKKTFFQFFKAMCKTTIFFFINKKKYLIYLNRFLGLYNSYQNKPSWRRPNIK